MESTEESIISRTIDFFVLTLEQEVYSVHHIKLFDSLITYGDRDVVKYFLPYSDSEKYNFFAINYAYFNIAQGYVSLRTDPKILDQLEQQNFKTKNEHSEQQCVEFFQKTLQGSTLHYEYLMKSLETSKERFWNFFVNYKSSDKYRFFKNHPCEFSITSDGFVSANRNASQPDIMDKAVIKYIKKLIRSNGPMHYRKLIYNVENSDKDFKNYFNGYPDSDNFWYFKEERKEFVIDSSGYVSVSYSGDSKETVPTKISSADEGDMEAKVTNVLIKLLEVASPRHYEKLVIEVDRASDSAVATFFSHYSDLQKFLFFQEHSSFLITEHGHVFLSRNQKLQNGCSSVAESSDYTVEQAVDFLTNCLQLNGPMDYTKLFDCLRKAPSEELHEFYTRYKVSERLGFFNQSFVFNVNVDNVVSLAFETHPLSKGKTFSDPKDETNMEKIAIDLLAKALRKSTPIHFEKLFNVLETNSKTNVYSMSWTTMAEKHKYFRDRSQYFDIGSASYVSLKKCLPSVTKPVQSVNTTTKTSARSSKNFKTSDGKPKYGHQALSLYFAKLLKKPESMIHYERLFKEATQVSDHFKSVVRTIDASAQFHFFKEMPGFHINGDGLVNLDEAHPPQVYLTTAGKKAVQPMNSAGFVQGTVTPVLQNSKSTPQKPVQSSKLANEMPNSLVNGNGETKRDGVFSTDRVKAEAVPSIFGAQSLFSNLEGIVPRPVEQTNKIPDSSNGASSAVETFTQYFRNFLSENIRVNKFHIINMRYFISGAPHEVMRYYLAHSAEHVLDVFKRSKYFVVDESSFISLAHFDDGQTSTSADPKKASQSASPKSEEKSDEIIEFTEEDDLITFFVNILRYAEYLHHDQLFSALGLSTTVSSHQCLNMSSPAERVTFFKKHQHHFIINSQGIVSLTSSRKTTSPDMSPMSTKNANKGSSLNKNDITESSASIQSSRNSTVVDVGSLPLTKTCQQCFDDAHLSVLRSSIAILKYRDKSLHPSELVDLLCKSNEQTKDFFKFFSLHDVLEFFHVHSPLFDMDSGFVISLNRSDVVPDDALKSDLLMSISNLLELQTLSFLSCVSPERFLPLDVPSLLVLAPAYIFLYFAHNYSGARLLQYFRNHWEYFTVDSSDFIVRKRKFSAPELFLFEKDISTTQRLTENEKQDRLKYIESKMIEDKPPFNQTEKAARHETNSKTTKEENVALLSETSTSHHGPRLASHKSSVHSSDSSKQQSSDMPASETVSNSGSSRTESSSLSPLSDSIGNSAGDSSESHKKKHSSGVPNVIVEDSTRVKAKLVLNNAQEKEDESVIRSASKPDTGTNDNNVGKIIHPSLRQHLQHISRNYDSDLDVKAVQYFSQILRNDLCPLPVPFLENRLREAPQDVQRYLHCLYHGRDFALFFYLHLEEFAVDCGEYVHLRMRDILLSRASNDLSHSTAKHFHKVKELKAVNFFSCLLRQSQASVPLRNLEDYIWRASDEVQEYLSVNYCRNLRLFFQNNSEYFQISDTDEVALCVAVHN